MNPLQLFTLLSLLVAVILIAWNMHTTQVEIERRAEQYVNLFEDITKLLRQMSEVFMLMGDEFHKLNVEIERAKKSMEELYMRLSELESRDEKILDDGP